MTPNPSIERTHNGGPRWLAPSKLAAPLCATHVKRWAAMSLVLLHQILLATLALSVPVLALVIAGHLAWCIFQAFRAARFGIVAMSIAGITCLVAIVVVVVVVWFAYGVAHSEKTLWTDLRVTAITILPFYGACYVLWRIARALQARLTSGAA